MKYYTNILKKKKYSWLTIDLHTASFTASSCCYWVLRLTSLKTLFFSLTARITRANSKPSRSRWRHRASSPAACLAISAAMTTMMTAWRVSCWPFYFWLSYFGTSTISPCLLYPSSSSWVVTLCSWQSSDDDGGRGRERGKRGGKGRGWRWAKANRGFDSPMAEIPLKILNEINFFCCFHLKLQISAKLLSHVHPWHSKLPQKLPLQK